MNKAELVAAIAEIVVSRKMPLLLDVKDISTDDVRIELQLKKDAEIDKVMAFLFKHTLLQTNFNVNLTCLIPTDNPEVGRPERLGLKQILWHFLHFRLEVVTKRLAHELEQLRKRIHTLEGFAFAFDILDDLIKIIRASEGKADAADADPQEVRRRTARPPQAQGRRPRPRAGRRHPGTQALPPRPAGDQPDHAKNWPSGTSGRRRSRPCSTEEQATGRWGIVRQEIEELARTFGKEPKNKRRTLIEAAENEVEYSAEDFIVAEDNHVLVTADGWVKRQKEINPETTRLREGDRILSLVAGSTRATIVFFSNFGTAYTARIIDIPATTGYGEPIQKLFKLKDGEKIVAAISIDERVLPPKATAVDEKKPDAAPKLHGLAVTSDGYSLRFGLDGYREVSTKAGRRYARPAEGAEVTLAAVVERQRDRHRRQPEPPRAAVQGRRDQLPLRPRQGRAADQAGRRRPPARRHHRHRRPRHAHRQDQHGRRAAAEHRPLQGHRPRRPRARVRQPRADRRSGSPAGAGAAAAGRVRMSFD